MGEGLVRVVGHVVSWLKVKPCICKMPFGSASGAGARISKRRRPELVAAISGVGDNRKSATGASGNFVSRRFTKREPSDVSSSRCIKKRKMPS